MTLNSKEKPHRPLGNQGIEGRKEVRRIRVALRRRKG